MSASYLTRRQRSYASQASHNNPHSLEPFSAALIPNHERGSVQTSLGGGVRSRRRGSPFAALSEAYKPARAAIFSHIRRRDGGEVLGLRSSNFLAWPKSAERLPADPRHTQNPAEVEVLAAKKPVLLLPRKKTDENAVIGRWVSSSSSSSSSSSATTIADDGAARLGRSPMATTAPTRSTLGPTTTPTSPSRRHVRRVSWPEDVVRSVHRIPATADQADVYSPDLHALDIAKELATRARNPELRRAALQVDYCRRHAAITVRSLTSKQNGGLEGVEEACRLFTWREAAFLREADDLVRSIVVEGGQKQVWQLKASFRAARRRMEDADSD